MAFFKKKTADPKPLKARSLSEIATERFLTAEGWQRRLHAESAKKPKKK